MKKITTPRVICLLFLAKYGISLFDSHFLQPKHLMFGDLLGGLVVVILGCVITSLVIKAHQLADGDRMPGVPRTAEFLFYLFLDSKDCDALVGDIEERYRLIRKKFGKRRADFWYWTQAVRSVGPVAWAWAKKILVKPLVAVIAWAGANGLIGHDSWLAALVEIWKRIRP